MLAEALIGPGKNNPEGASIAFKTHLRSTRIKRTALLV